MTHTVQITLFYTLGVAFRVAVIDRNFKCSIEIEAVSRDPLASADKLVLVARFRQERR